MRKLKKKKDEKEKISNFYKQYFDICIYTNSKKILAKLKFYFSIIFKIIDIVVHSLEVGEQRKLKFRSEINS